MADQTIWPALVIRAGRILEPLEEETLAALLDDFHPTAVQDLADLPLPPGGLWDHSFPPPPEPPPAPLHWRVFFASVADRHAARQAVADAYPDLGLAADDVPDDDWAARSQRDLTAVRAGRFIVAPPWDVPRDADATVIIIEPSRGFGTGHHASTRLCLRALSDLDVRGQRVIDLGTGSGVLAMAASLHGARQVLAVDLDPDAIASARESAALNPRLDVVHWMVGDFRDAGWDVLTGGPADLVLANLTGGMLIAAAARIRALVAPGGVVIASGLVTSELAEVEAALGLTRRHVLHEDEWIGLVMDRPSDR